MPCFIKEVTTTKYTKQTSNEQTNKQYYTIHVLLFYFFSEQHLTPMTLKRDQPCISQVLMLAWALGMLVATCGKYSKISLLRPAKMVAL